MESIYKRPSPTAFVHNTPISRRVMTINDCGCNKESEGYTSVEMSSSNEGKAIYNALVVSVFGLTIGQWIGSVKKGFSDVYVQNILGAGAVTNNVAGNITESMLNADFKSVLAAKKISAADKTKLISAINNLAIAEKNYYFSTHTKELADLKKLSDEQMKKQLAARDAEGRARAARDAKNNENWFQKASDAVVDSAQSVGGFVARNAVSAGKDVANGTKAAVGFVAKNIKSAAKDIKDVFVKGVMFIPCEAFLGLLELNVNGMAHTLMCGLATPSQYGEYNIFPPNGKALQGVTQTLINHWSDWKQNTDALKSAIQHGAKKEAIFNIGSGGRYYTGENDVQNFDPVTVSTSVGSASAIIAGVVSNINNVKNLLSNPSADNALKAGSGLAAASGNSDAISVMGTANDISKTADAGQKLIASVNPQQHTENQNAINEVDKANADPEGYTASIRQAGVAAAPAITAITDAHAAETSALKNKTGLIIGAIAVVIGVIIVLKAMKKI
jgi:hypothetical protein